MSDTATFETPIGAPPEPPSGRGYIRDFIANLGPAGIVPLVILIGLATAQSFDSVAFGVLSPDIRHTFGVSKGTITVIASLTAAVPIIFAVFLGFAGDRGNRVRISTAAAVLWGATALLSGLAPVIALLVVARVIGGVGLLSTETIYPSLLSDYYPPQVAGAVFGAYRFLGAGLGLIGGPMAGAIGAAMGWRAAFVILALPTFGLAFLTFTVLREPARGASAAGVDMGVEKEASILEGYRRVRAIPTLRRTWMAAFLFGGGTIPFATILSNFFKDVYHTGDTTRGLLSALYGVGGLVGIALGGLLAQRGMAQNRYRWLASINGLMIVEFGVGIALMGASPVFIGSVIAATLLSIGAFGFLPAYTTMVSVVAPPRLRSQAYAWSLFWYALGGIVVSVVIGSISNSHGERVSLYVLSGIVLVGGIIGASVRDSVAVDMERALRMEAATKSDALLFCRGVDAAYGGVQVLFGVDFEIQKGEMVALLGTNGAGKSTFLKTITGLLDPVGGAILFNGRDITHTDPMATARLGIMQVPGGRGIFPTISVADNLKVAGWLFRKDKAYVDKAVEQVLEYFPVLRERWNTLAGDMSGGEQQMLSLAQAFIAEPELLLIDELSLGLAPTIVARLVEILRKIHAKGTTIILVEQSVNTALELAERAIFMEKGEVRFSGPTAELLQRPDILRAVFLQGAAAGEEEMAGGGSKAVSVREANRARREAEEAAAELLERPVVLEAVGVTKRYGGVTAVNGVSFELHEGEILGFIGPNGAGKTTLFDLISGFGAINAGRVIFHGQDVTAWGAPKRAAAGLGRSFQDARLWPALTVAECLAVSLHSEGEIEAVLPAMLGVPRVAASERMIHERVDELVDLMGLNAFRNKFIGELSTGSRRIVELAAMLAHRPSVLLLDEPSSGIAQRETEALGPLIKRIRAQLGCAVLVIEHDIPLISTLADHLVGLDLGTVVAYGRPQEVLNDPHVVESYLGGAADKLAAAGVTQKPPAKRSTSRSRTTGNGASTSSSSSESASASDDPTIEQEVIQ